MADSSPSEWLATMPTSHPCPTVSGARDHHTSPVDVTEQHLPVAIGTTSIVDALLSLERPVTVDELIDGLASPNERVELGHDMEAWGDLHEVLHEVILPVSNDLGYLCFDSRCGLIWLPEDV